MLTTILFIRHGQTDWNVAQRWQGHSDIPLNDTGRLQARLLAERLAAYPIRAVYSSDLARASETAAILAERHGLTPILHSALRERFAGQFQGHTAEELTEKYGEVWRRVRQENATPPGGESLKQVAERAYQVYEAIVQQNHNQCVAVVSHGGTLNLLIAAVLGFPLGQLAHISLRGNTGLSIVEINETGPRLTALNDTAHLDSALARELKQAPYSPAEIG